MYFFFYFCWLLIFQGHIKLNVANVLLVDLFDLFLLFFICFLLFRNCELVISRFSVVCVCVTRKSLLHNADFVCICFYFAFFNVIHWICVYVLYGIYIWSLFVLLISNDQIIHFDLIQNHQIQTNTAQFWAHVLNKTVNFSFVILDFQFPFKIELPSNILHAIRCITLQLLICSINSHFISLGTRLFLIENYFLLWPYNICFSLLFSLSSFLIKFYCCNFRYHLLTHQNFSRNSYLLLVVYCSRKLSVPSNLWMCNCSRGKHNEKLHYFFHCECCRDVCDLTFSNSSTEMTQSSQMTFLDFLLFTSFKSNVQSVFTSLPCGTKNL